MLPLDFEERKHNSENIAPIKVIGFKVGHPYKKLFKSNVKKKLTWLPLMQSQGNFRAMRAIYSGF
jgi:hypothetical protein